jgi:hypothetical protein
MTGSPAGRDGRFAPVRVVSNKLLGTEERSEGNRGAPLRFSTSTLIVVHDSGRVYPEAVIFAPTAPKKATSRGLRASLHHFESKVGGARCLDRACPPQFDPLRVEILEEPDAAAE